MSSTTQKVLLVDDDPNILAGFKRNLRKRFDIKTATGGKEALALLDPKSPFAVIVSDMQMPEMNGVEFLQLVGQQSPDSVRMMLTGNADQKTATEAINEGRIFRFLNKPCSAEQLTAAIEEGIQQYRLIIAEKEILENTLGGSIKLVCDILSLINPAAFGRASRIQRIVRQLCDTLNLNDRWQLEMSAMLSQLGCVTIPQDILERHERNEVVKTAEIEMLQSHPKVAKSLLSNIPRMENVAKLIGGQHLNLGPGQNRTVQFVSKEAAILQIAIDCESYESLGDQNHVIIEKLKQSCREFPPDLIEAIDVVLAAVPKSCRSVQIDDLSCGDVLGADVQLTDGRILVRQGQEITESLMERLRNFGEQSRIDDVIVIFENTPTNNNAESTVLT